MTGPILGAKPPVKLVRSERCENCKWAGPASDPGLPVGTQICRGGPPSSQIRFGKDAQGREVQQTICNWPLVSGEDWCGAWKPRIEMVQ